MDRVSLFSAAKANLNIVTFGFAPIVSQERGLVSNCRLKQTSQTSLQPVLRLISWGRLWLAADIPILELALLALSFPSPLSLIHI